MDWTSRILTAGVPSSGSPEPAAGGSLPPGARGANAHVHLPPNFSAFESVDQAVELAARQGVGILGVSNYYDFSIYPRFAEKALARGICPLFGLEIIALLDDIKRAGVLINDPGNPGKMYICGKGITRFAEMTPEARRLIGIIRARDDERMERMAGLLRGIFAAAGIAAGLDASAVIDGIVERAGVERGIATLQERHLAEAFQQELFRTVAPEDRPEILARLFGSPSKAGPDDRVAVQNEIRSRLMKTGRPAFVEESFVGLDDARRLILELGGIPCYPTLADGTSPICGYEDPPEKLIQTLGEHGIFCAEFIPLRNDPRVLARYVEAFRNAGFVVTGGTEHNTPDLVAMEPACRGGLPVPEAVKDIFLEGAHVVVAHQFLALRGEAGYVDGSGNLNPGFAGTEERIDHFRRLGASIVDRLR